MAEMNICWVSKNGHHFDTQEEANQHDAVIELDENISKILDVSDYLAFRIRNRRKQLFDALKEYYKEGGK